MSAVDEKLSVIVPCFNEEASVGALLERLLAKRLAIPKEVVVVESHSSDRTRAIVEGFRDRTDVTLVFEDCPRGKGHAVRAGLAAATGIILLIQDADLEYDVDDYDALLEPILSRRATFVLGSRSLGPRGWRVRSLPESPFTEVTLNLAQVAFARTFNLLYGQRTTDINTMFKVFRAECLDGISFACDCFAFDMERAQAHEARSLARRGARALRRARLLGREEMVLPEGRLPVVLGDHQAPVRGVGWRS